MSETESVRRAIPMVGDPYKTPKGEAAPAEGTVKHWGLRKKWPHWLVAAMAIQRHENEVLTEDEIHSLAESTYGLPLGTPKGAV